MKTTPKLIPATVMARESYLLSLAIIGYHNTLFPADKHLCYQQRWQKIFRHEFVILNKYGYQNKAMTSVPILQAKVCTYLPGF